MRHLWPAVLFFAGFSLLAGAETAFPPGSPVFDAAKPEARLLGVLPKTFRSSSAPVRGWFRTHPLARYADYYALTLPDGTQGFVTPDAQVREGEPRWTRDAPFAGKLLIPAALGVLFFCLYRLYRFPADRKKPGYYTAIVISARVALLAYVVCMAGNIVCNPADEPGYFAVGYDVLHGKFAGPWTYPAGHGVLMMLPWIALTGARDYFDLAVPLSWFSGFVLGPLALFLGFRILLALKIGLKTAFAGILAWALLPFFVHHAPDWIRLDFTNFFGMPSFTMSFRYYMELIGSGFNGMSDMFAAVLVFACLFFALQMPVRLRYLAAVSFLFGLACLVRLNNIFYAPVLGFLLLARFMPTFADYRAVVRFLLVGSAAYLAVVGIQFAVNHHQFGDCWTFPYSLHSPDRAPGDRPADGFTLATLLKGTNLRYLLESNRFVLSFAIAGLVLLPDRKLRAVLGLWSIPVILFFCGYSHTFCDAVRFILPTYVPLLAAAACGFAARRRDKRWLVAGFAAAAGLILWHNGVAFAILLAVLLARSICDAARYLTALRIQK